MELDDGCKVVTVSLCMCLKFSIKRKFKKERKELKPLLWDI